MNINVFSCLNFELTSVKQTTLNKQGSTQKYTHKYMSSNSLVSPFYVKIN